MRGAHGEQQQRLDAVGQAAQVQADRIKELETLHAAEAGRLQEQIGAFERQLSEARNDASAARGQIDELINAAKATEATLAALTASKRALQQELDEAKQVGEQLHLDMKLKESELAARQAQIDALTGDVQAGREQVETQAGRCASLQEQLVRLQDAKEGAEGVKAQVEAEWSGKYAEQVDKNTALSGRVAELEAAQHAATAELATVRGAHGEQQQRLDAALASLQAAQESDAATQTKVALLEAALKVAAAESDKLHEAVAAHARAEEQGQARIRELESAIEALKTDMQQQQGTAATSLKQAIDDKEKLQAKHHELKEKSTGVMKLLKESKAKLAETETELARHVALQSQEQGLAASLQETVHSLQQRVAQQEAQLAQSKVEFEQQLRVAQDGAAARTDELKQAHDAVDVARARLEATDKQLHTLEAALAAKDSERSEWLSQSDAAAQAMAAQSQDNAALQAKLSEALQLVQSLESASQGNVAQLEALNAHLCEQAKQTEDELSRQCSINANLKDRASSLAKELAGLQEQLNDSRQEASEARAVLQQRTTQLSALQLQQSQLQEALDQSQTSLDDHRAREDAAQHQQGDVQARLEQAVERLQATEMERDAVKHHHDALQQLNRQLAAELKSQQQGQAGQAQALQELAESLRQSEAAREAAQSALSESQFQVGAIKAEHSSVRLELEVCRRSAVALLIVTVAGRVGARGGRPAARGAAAQAGCVIGVGSSAAANNARRHIRTAAGQVRRAGATDRIDCGGPRARRGRQDRRADIDFCSGGHWAQSASRAA